MFRELRYGVLFFLAACAGAVIGVECLVPAVYSGSYEGLIQQELTAVVVGTIGGSVVWLWYRYSFLPPKSSG